MSKSNKIRLDQLMVERGLAESRTRAQALIMAGKVVVAQHRADKPGMRVDRSVAIRLKGSDHPYVSRAGVKLAGALDEFGLNVHGWTVLDVGASTGGFTDCLLQNGASRVYALDVGRGQLHEKLRQDERVVNIESINARYLPDDILGRKVDLVVMDVSFISLELLIEPVSRHLEPGGVLLALVKPQFEVGKDLVGKGGIVRDESLREACVDKVSAYARSLGLIERARCTSCLPGTDGNLEFFLLFSVMEI